MGAALMLVRACLFYHEEHGVRSRGRYAWLVNGSTSRPVAQASAKESGACLRLGKQVSHTETGLSSQDGWFSERSGLFGL